MDIGAYQDSFNQIILNGMAPTSQYPGHLSRVKKKCASLLI